MIFTPLVAALALGSTAFAHMEMSEPAPFRSKANKNAGSNIDYSMTAPLGDGKGLCKGYQTDMSDLKGAGAPTASYKAGGPASLTLVGGAVHGGGSCQASLSYDQGKTFKVIHSWMGSCPLASGDKFDFNIPSDAKEGSALLAWTWFNKLGNREMYMNCASVTIEAGSGSSPAVAFDKRPSIFIANKPLADDCATVEGKSVKFPDPGPDVTGDGDEGGYSGSGCGKASSAPSGGNSQTPSTPADPAPSGDDKTSPPAAPSPPANGSPNQAPVVAPGGTKPTTSGSCGNGETCTGTSFGHCCSKFGFCGSAPEHCGDGCQSGFGTCGSPKMIRGATY
jgi:hypothetical protein